MAIAVGWLAGIGTLRYAGAIGYWSHCGITIGIAYCWLASNTLVMPLSCGHYATLAIGGHWLAATAHWLAGHNTEGVIAYARSTLALILLTLSLLMLPPPALHYVIGI